MSRISALLKETKLNRIAPTVYPAAPIRWTASVVRHGMFVLVLGVASALLSWNVAQPWVGYSSAVSLAATDSCFEVPEDGHAWRAALGVFAAHMPTGGRESFDGAFGPLARKIAILLAQSTR